MKKGVLKGLKYISQIFGADEEQEEEMQIGLPTDVKHVAHIGMDGPSTESPSWMKDYKGPERPQSAPLDNNGEPLDSSDQKSRDMPDLPKSSRRTQSADSLSIQTPEREISTKSKGSGRRHHRKESSEDSHHKSRRRHHRKDSSLSDREGSSRSGRGGHSQDLDVPESPLSPTSRKLPDIPKSSRRKKSKDDSGSTKSKDVVPQTTTYTCPFSDPAGQGVTNETTMSCNSESCQTC